MIRIGGTAKPARTRSVLRCTCARASRHSATRKPAISTGPKTPNWPAEEAQRAHDAVARVGPVGIGFGVTDGRKAVGGVPGNVGREQHEADHKDRRAARAQHQLARIVRDKGRRDRTDDEIEHRVFGKQAIAERDAAEERPAPALLVERAQEGVERDGPAEQQRHVGRDQAAGIGDARAAWRRRARSRSRAARRPRACRWRTA